ncbi:hypothetical protein PENTCL1PPCAC_16084, partial [Pristionchus entomophagus]
SSIEDFSENEDDYKIDSLFYRICYFCMILGVNFYCNRGTMARCLSLVIVTINCSINFYFIGYIARLCLSQKFEANRVATSITLGTWVFQATMSTICLAFWQSTNEPSKVLDLLYKANKGAGIHHRRHCLVAIMRSFYFVIGRVDLVTLMSSFRSVLLKIFSFFFQQF